jgi:hypothetical protein
LNELVLASDDPRISKLLLVVQIQKIILYISVFFLGVVVKDITNKYYSIFIIFSIIYSTNFPNFGDSLKQFPILQKFMETKYIYLILFLFISAFLINYKIKPQKIFLWQWVLSLLVIVNFTPKLINFNFLAPDGGVPGNHLSSILSEGLSIPFFVFLIGLVLRFLNQPSRIGLNLIIILICILILIREQFFFLILIIVFLNFYVKRDFKNREITLKRKVSYSIIRIAAPMLIFIFSSNISYLVQSGDEKPINGIVYGGQRSYSLIILAMDVVTLEDLKYYKDPKLKLLMKNLIDKKLDFESSNDDTSLFVAQNRSRWLNIIAAPEAMKFSENNPEYPDFTKVLFDLSVPIIIHKTPEIVSESLKPFMASIGIKYPTISRIFVNQNDLILLSIFYIYIFVFVRSKILNSYIVLFSSLYFCNNLVTSFMDYPSSRNTWYFEIFIALPMLLSLYTVNINDRKLL